MSFSPHWIKGAILDAFRETQTTAHRLYSEPGCWIERYGNDAVVCLESPAKLERQMELLLRWSSEHQLPLYRIYFRHVSKDPSGRLPPVFKWGRQESQPETTAMENGLAFQIRYDSGYSTGLFIDQRANRSFLRQLRPASVLNCFSYTCSFSVAAAAAGASTLSVDVSKHYLALGKGNLSLNKLDNGSHRFITDDVQEVLPRLERRGERFDAIILDPPTFGRGPKKVFRIEKDLPELLEASLACLNPGGRLLLSSNCQTLAHKELKELAMQTARSRKEALSFHPGDSLPDIPESMMPATLWIRKGS